MEEEPVMSRRERKKARKEAKRKAKEEKQAMKAAGKAEDEDTDEGVEQSENHQDVEVFEQVPENDFAESRITEDDKKLFEETGNFLAASIADMMETPQEDVSVTKVFAAVTEEIEDNKVLQIEEVQPQGETEVYKRKIAMPVYTKEELLEKARAAGEEPDIVEDKNSGITFLDYSDIL